MWARFTERARKACFFAQADALELKENYVSTEHLLLGVLKDPSEQLKSLFIHSGKTIDDVRTEIKNQMPRTAPIRKGSEDMTLTPRAKRVIDLAYDEVRQMQTNYLHDFHLFLGLLREADGLAGQVLNKMGFDLHDSREFLSCWNPEINDDTSEESTNSENNDKIQTLKMLKLSSIEAISKVFDDLISELTKKS